MIKICYDGRYLQQKMFGLPRYLLSLLYCLNESPGFRVTVFKNSKQQLDIPSNIAQKYLSPSYSRFFPIWEHVSLPIEICKYQIFHAPNNYGIPLFSLKNTIKVLTVHDIIPHIYPQVFSPRHLMYWKKSLSISMERADCIITVSGFVKKMLIERFKIDPGKIRVIYNCIDDKIFSPSEIPIDKNVSNNFSILQNKKYLFYHGGYRVYKNVEFLIDCFNKIKTICKDLYLVLSGELSSEVSEKVKKMNNTENILITGFIGDNELKALLRNAYLSISPSLIEGFNYPPLEALFSGTATLVSDIPINREILGNYTYYFDPTIQESFIENVLKIIKTEQKPMIPKNIQDKLREKYSIKTFSENYFSLYKNVYNQE